MNRRYFLGSAAAAMGAASVAVAQDSGADPGPWARWKSRFLASDGRVIDWAQGGISHSEGQAYGALLAQATGDEQAFRLIESWTQHHLTIRQDRLMAWRWNPGPGGGRVPDWHNATDGDLFRAWALLRAARDSGWAMPEAEAAGIARDLAALCLASDPRAPAELLLRPGAEARRDRERVLLNPSYIMPRALRELGEAFDLPQLIRAGDHGLTILAELSDADLLADWIDRIPDGFDRPSEHDMRWSYDAIRIPLYLIWSGEAGHPAVARSRALMDLSSVPDHVAVRIGPDGDVSAVSNSSGYLAIRRLSACQAFSGDHPDGGVTAYYPQTLHLLAAVALREGSCADEPRH